MQKNTDSILKINHLYTLALRLSANPKTAALSRFYAAQAKETGKKVVHRLYEKIFDFSNLPFL
jgi:hypothetical protein